MGRMTTRREVMPLLPVVFGLGEQEAAAAIGISASKFRLLVNERRMPSPSAWMVIKSGTLMSCGLHSKRCRMRTTKRLIHGETWRNPAENMCTPFATVSGACATISVATVSAPPFLASRDPVSSWRSTAPHLLAGERTRR